MPAGFSSAQALVNMANQRDLNLSLTQSKVELQPVQNIG